MYYLSSVVQWAMLASLYLTLSFTASQNDDALMDSVTYSINPPSTLEIHGESNVHSFICESRAAYPKRPITFHKGKRENKLFFEHTKLDLHIKEMDCGGRGINRDFQKTLRADEYPLVTIELVSLTLPKNFQTENSNQPATAATRIHLAGAEKHVELSIGIVKLEEHKYHVVGICPLKMSDFHIEPPSALFGLIKVENEITIHMDLYLQLHGLPTDHSQ